MKNNKIPYFALMHLGFLIYSLYIIVGKIASKYERLSIQFCILYCIVIFILFIYAIIWQQVLKYFRLPVAISNKAMTIVWGMLFSSIFFSEQITIKKISGAILILSGIFVLSISDSKKTAKKEDL